MSHMKPSVRATAAVAFALSLATLTVSVFGAPDRRSSGLAASETPAALPCAAAPPAVVQPYLVGFTPAVVLADGTQIYHGVSTVVRQPDGSEQIVATTVKLTPVASVPVFQPHDAARSP